MSEERKTLSSIRHIVLFVLALLSSLTHGAIYIHVDGIRGDATAAGFVEHIEAVSVGHGVSRAFSASTGGGAPAPSPPDFTDISVIKGLDRSSPQLLIEATSNTPIPEVTIYFVTETDTPQVYYEIRLEGAFISSVNHAFQNDGTPFENVTFVFAKIIWEYTPYDNQGQPGGSIRGGYDLLTGTSI